MSEIQLSPQLFQDIQQAVTRQHPDADQGMIMQYLAAVMGYLLASQQNLSEQQRNEYLDELCGFARHVADDVGSQNQQRQSAAAQNAFGYWDPKKN